jgi:hypothetical protein
VHNGPFCIPQALLRICRDAQLLVDLYLNYDCDLNLDNLFSRMIADVSRIAQGRQSTELGGTPQQEAALKHLVRKEEGGGGLWLYYWVHVSNPCSCVSPYVQGLECLVAILASMSEWMRTTDESPHGPDTAHGMACCATPWWARARPA